MRPLAISLRLHAPLAGVSFITLLSSFSMSAVNVTRSPLANAKPGGSSAKVTVAVTA